MIVEMHLSFDRSDAEDMVTLARVTAALADKPEAEASRPEPAKPERKPRQKPEPKSEPKPSADIEEEEIPAPVDEPEPQEDLLGSVDEEPEQTFTVQDALDAAAPLIAGDKGAVVKKALNAVGAQRVGQLKPEQIANFIKALGE